MLKFLGWIGVAAYLTLCALAIWYGGKYWFYTRHQKPRDPSEGE